MQLYGFPMLLAVSVILLSQLCTVEPFEKASACWRHSCRRKLYFSTIWINMDSTHCNTKWNSVSLFSKIKGTASSGYWCYRVQNIFTCRIADIIITPPSGIHKSALSLTNVLSHDQWNMTITWTPTTSEAGPTTNVICFYAVDIAGCVVNDVLWDICDVYYTVTAAVCSWHGTCQCRQRRLNKPLPGTYWLSEFKLYDPGADPGHDEGGGTKYIAVLRTMYALIVLYGAGGGDAPPEKVLNFRCSESDSEAFWGYLDSLVWWLSSQCKNKTRGPTPPRHTQIHPPF